MRCRLWLVACSVAARETLPRCGSRGSENLPATVVESKSVTRLRRHAILFVLLLSPCVIAHAQSAPSIINLSPNSGPIGGALTITGSGFGATPYWVDFPYGVGANVTSWSDTQIVVSVPRGATTGSVTVVLPTQSSNGMPFTVTTPSAGAASPPSGAPGTVVTVMGSGFGTSPGTVIFNGVPAAVTSWGDTQIVTTVPNGAATGYVVVVTAGGASTPAWLVFLVTTGPDLTSIALNPRFPTIPAGAQQQFTVIGTYSDGSTRTLQAVGDWTSSSTSVATVNSAGLATAVTQGRTLIGTVMYCCGASDWLTVTAPALASIAVTPANPSVVQGATQQFTATGTYTDGSTQDLTSTVTWASSPTSVATISPIGLATTVGPGTTNITATSSTVSGSTVLTVAPPPPNITGLSQSSAAIGAHVTVSGSGFGSTQGGSMLSIGGQVGVIQSWSDGQIIATVPVGATSGSVFVQEGRVQSNSVAFTVLGPSIANLGSTSGSIGQQVTISGSNFGASSGQVFIGSQTMTILTWSDTQVTAQIAPGTTTGVLSIYANGIFSNTVLFTVNTPQLNSIVPNSGPPGQQVTLNGANFGAQGTGSVTIGNQPAVIQSWSDTQIVANVASNATRGNAVVTQGGAQSNAIFFHLIAPTTALTLSPANVAMLPGTTRSFSLTDQNGEPVTGATWSVDNTAVLALFSSDQALFTAQGPGTAKITASIGGISAQVTVNVYAAGANGDFPTGTPLWSLSDTSATFTLQATPTGSNMPDFFGVGTAITALTADGRQLWRVANNMGALMPDNSGGLLGFNGSAQHSTLNGLDRSSGSPAWQYTSPILSSNSLSRSSIATNGVAVQSNNTTFFVERYYLAGSNYLSRLVGVKQGIPVFQQTLPGFSVISRNDVDTCEFVPSINSPNAGPITIGTDSSVYLEITHGTINDGYTCAGQYDTYRNEDSTLSLLKVDASGNSAMQTLHSWSVHGINVGTNEVNYPRQVIPDGQGGILAAWDHIQLDPNTLAQTSSSAKVTHIDVNGNVSEYTLPLASWCGEGANGNVQQNVNCFYLFNNQGSSSLPAKSMVLGDNNTAFATNGDKLVAFAVSSGAPQWNWSPPQTHSVALVAISSGGGLVAKDITPGTQGGTASESVVRFDPSGVPTYDAPLGASASNVDYYHDNVWLGTQNAVVGAVFASPIHIGISDFAFQLGNAQRQVRATEGVRFVETAACSGFDDSVSPHWLVVPLNGNNTATVTIKEGYEDVGFVSGDVNIATVSPDGASGHSNQLTIHGVSVGVTTIRATSRAANAAPAQDYGTIKVTVKPRLDFTVDLFSITEPQGNIAPTNLPITDLTQARNLQAYLNSLYNSQANIYWTVTSAITPESIHYDLNADGRLEEHPSGNAEETAIITALFNEHGNVPNSHNWVTLVHDINPTSTAGFAVPGGLVFLQDADTLTDHQAHKTAHELGHVHNVGYNSREARDLMYEHTSTTPTCVIPHEHAMCMNPTPGDPGDPTSDEFRRACFRN